MILPSKHISNAESLLGLGGLILSYVSEGPQTIDSIWSSYSTAYNRQEYPAYHSFDNIILATDLLYIIGAIKINKKGEIIIA